jgi:hypothetical protein
MKMKKLIAVSAVFMSTALLLPSIASADKEWKFKIEKLKKVRNEFAKKVRLYEDRLAVGRELIEVQSSNWPEVVPYYTDDIEYHDPIVDIYGIDMMAGFLGQLFTSSSNLVTIVEDETCVNGIYTCSWVMQGEFNGVPYTAPGMSIIKFMPGEARVYYQRDYYTESDIMKNIPGLDEAVLGFRTYYKCAVDPSFDCPLPPPE